MDCPQLTKKRLRETRNVDFHREKLAISEFYCKLIFSRGVYEGGGGGGGLPFTGWEILQEIS